MTFVRGRSAQTIEDVTKRERLGGDWPRADRELIAVALSRALR